MAPLNNPESVKKNNKPRIGGERERERERERESARKQEQAKYSIFIICQ
jgi:hypothetical protein